MYVILYLCKLGMYGSMLPVDVFPVPGSGFPLLTTTVLSFLILPVAFLTWLVPALKMAAIFFPKRWYPSTRCTQLITKGTKQMYKLSLSNEQCHTI